MTLCRSQVRATGRVGARSGATLALRADVAELVDAHGSGPCALRGVEVQVLSSGCSRASPQAAVLGFLLRAPFLRLAVRSGKPSGSDVTRLAVPHRTWGWANIRAAACAAGSRLSTA